MIKKLNLLGRWWYRSQVLFRIIQLAFPYFIVVTYTCLLLETVTYPGFLRKFIFLNATWVAMLVIAMGVVVVLSLPKKTNQDGLLLDLTFTVNRLLVPALLFVYFLITIEETTHFPNYVFSTFHIHPAHFGLLIAFNLALVCLDVFRPWRHKILEFILRQRTWPDTLFMVIVPLAILFGFKQLILAGQTVLEYNSFLLLNPLASYETKLSHKVSDYPFFAFVAASTPADSVIVVPPQQSPWLTSGNVGYIRHFLYPRKVVQGTLESWPLPDSAEYVLIAKGEWPVADQSLYGWPKARIPAEKIWYFDPQSKHAYESNATVFDPALAENSERWGLIKIQKDL